MAFKTIEKKNFWYILLLKTIVSPWFNHVFYRKISVNYLERIPKDGMLIFTPNHQNALVDALAPLCNINKQLVFLARSDIFKKKSTARILYFLKILPIFRIRDGYSELKKNDATLAKTIDVLNAGNGIVIFPEGNHEWKHKLRPFKKGHARIAFQTAEANEFKSDLKIVPVGLNYSDYKQIRSDLTINIGKPVSVSEYYSLYLESPAKAINTLNDKLYENLSPVMLNITHDADYEMIDFLSQFYCSKMSEKMGFTSCRQFDGFTAKKETISLLEKASTKKNDIYQKLKTAYENYTNLIRKTKIKSRFPEKEELSFVNIFHNKFILAVGFPFFLYGLINNIIPWLITKFLTRKVKDPTFINSFIYVISLLVFPLFYLLQTIIISQTEIPWWAWIIYAVSLPLSAAYSLDYALYLKKFYGKVNWLFYGWKNKKALSEIKHVKRLITSLMDELESEILRN